MYHLLRASYDYLESDYCEPPPRLPHEGSAVHHHDRKVTNLEHQGDGMRVTWESSAGDKGTLLADFVIGADGASSSVRQMVQPNAQRVYTGYCALRGTVPEKEVSSAAMEVLSQGFVFFHAKGVQTLSYLIPGKNGALEPGERLVNFLCYRNFPEDAAELAEIMTDKDGHRRHITMPPGKMSRDAWDKQIGKDVVPPQFEELMRKTQRPFVQTITDCIAPDNSYMDGKVILIGDALAGFRPHPGASTSQACFDAVTLADYFAGKITQDEWKKQTLEYARSMQKLSVEMGERNQFQEAPLEEYIRAFNELGKVNVGVPKRDT